MELSIEMVLSPRRAQVSQPLDSPFFQSTPHQVSRGGRRASADADAEAIVDVQVSVSRAEEEDLRKHSVFNLQVYDSL